MSPHPLWRFADARMAATLVQARRDRRRPARRGAPPNVLATAPWRKRPPR